jgi:hypothetical protein
MLFAAMHESLVGTNAKCRLHRAMSEFGVPENICSYRVLPSLARLRHADCVEQCPSSGAKRKTYARTEFFSV